MRGLLDTAQVLSHPFVVGELALGNLRQRDMILQSIRDLPRAKQATDDEVLHFIGRNDLTGKGVGYVDVHLLASTMLTAGCRFLTRDKRLAAVAERLDLGW